MRGWSTLNSEIKILDYLIIYDDVRVPCQQTTFEGIRDGLFLQIDEKTLRRSLKRLESRNLVNLYPPFPYSHYGINLRGKQETLKREIVRKGIDFSFGKIVRAKYERETHK